MPIFTLAKVASIAAWWGHGAAENLRGWTQEPHAEWSPVPGQDNASWSPFPMNESQAMTGQDNTSWPLFPTHESKAMPANDKASWSTSANMDKQQAYTLGVGSRGGDAGPKPSASLGSGVDPNSTLNGALSSGCVSLLEYGFSSDSGCKTFCRDMGYDWYCFSASWVCRCDNCPDDLYYC